MTQEDITFHGHAIECRINAEHPLDLPAFARHDRLLPSAGRRRRARRFRGLSAGYTIPPNYDFLVGKLIVHGRSRNEALMRLRRALDEFIVDGIDTTCRCFARWCATPTSRTALYDIHWLEKFLATGGIEPSF